MDDLDELARELEEFAAPDSKTGRPPRDERIVAGFEEIQRFVGTHGYSPRHGENVDIFERIYAARLDSIRRQPDCASLLMSHDHQGLLKGCDSTKVEPAEISDEELLSELADFSEDDDITNLRNVRPSSEIRAAEEIAGREVCKDFDSFKSLFTAVQRDLDERVRKKLPFGRDASVECGNFFIVNGQIAYVAEVGDPIKAPNGENDARLRVIYSNGTESNILRRSLQRALYKDDAGRRITDFDNGPLFGSTQEEDDTTTGTVYVLRSKSTHPYITKHRNVVHKIGVTGGSIDKRIANAEHEATYLLADVEVVASYRLINIDRNGMEDLLHKIFSPAQLNITIEDRFGKPVQPREWFMVPLSVIEQAIELIKLGAIVHYAYSPKEAKLVKRND